MYQITRNVAELLYGSANFLGKKTELSLDDVLKSDYKGILRNRISKNKKAKTLLFYNVKGGVGKTTLAFHAARFLALHGFRVCALGLDSSASLTKSFFGPEAKSINARFSLGTILQQIFMRENFSTQDSDLPNLEVIVERADIEAEFSALYQKWGRPEGYRRAEIFQEILIPTLSEYYDFIVIDAPPRIDEGFLPRNALKVADRVIVPIDPGVNTFEDFMDRYSLMEEAVGDNPEKKIKIVFNNFEKWAFCRQIEESLMALYPGQVMLPGLPRSASVNSARSDRLAVFEKFPKLKVSRDVNLLLNNLFADVMEKKNERKTNNTKKETIK